MDGIRTFVTAVIMVLAVQPSADCQPAHDVEQLRRQVRSLIDDGRYVEGENEARALVASFGALSDQNRLELNRAADLLVEALVRNGRGAEADTRKLAEELVRRRETARDREPADLATALRNLGDVLFHAGYYWQAIAPLALACRIHEETVTGTADAATDLDYLALTFLHVGLYDEALEISSRALAIKQKILEPTDISIATTLDTLARVRQRIGDYAQARSDLELALAIRERASSHPSVATTLMLLGTQLFVGGEVTKSRAVLERGLSLAETTLRANHPDLALLLRTLSIPLRELGDLRRARALRERAASIAEMSLGSEHPSVADSLNDLGGIFQIEGDYIAARSLYERALTIYERRLGSGYPGIATVVFNLALVNASLADLAGARALHQRAVSSWERLLGADRPIIARALLEFGRTLGEQGAHLEAIPLFERALAIRERTLGSDHIGVAEALSSLANSLLQLGQRRRAQQLSRRAMAIWNTSRAPETAAAFPNSLLVHAAVLSANGDLEGALDAYERVRQIQVQLLGESHPSVAQVKASLAAIGAQAGQPKNALALALDAEEIGRRHLSLMLASLPERQGLNYASKRPEGLTLALSLVFVTAGQESVLDALIRGRSLVLDEIASRHRALSDERASSVASLWAALTSARQRLANLTIQGPGRQPAQYTGLLEEAQRDKEKAEQALAEQSAAFRAERSRGDIGLEQVRAHLPASSALVSFVRYDRRVFVQRARQAAAGTSPELTRSVRIVPSYLAFVLRSDGSEPTVVPLASAATIDPLVASWRQRMIADITRPAGVPPSVPSFHALGVSLRRRIWDPVAANLGDAQHVFVVPDGTLNLVPFAALPTEGGRYLLESSRVIHYFSAERDLVTNDVSSSATGSGLLAVGGPAFDDASSFRAVPQSKPAIATSVPQTDDTGPKATRTEPAVSQTTPLRGAPSNCVSFRSMRFKTLPASRAEAESVTSLWQQFAVELAPNSQSAHALTGTDATELALKRSGPGRRVLHIATHGFFLGERCGSVAGGTRAVGGLVISGSKPAAGPQGTRAAPESQSLPENPLLLSGLALAGANRRAAASPDEDDGILTAEEVASLNLRSVEWAVLSACDTGLGTLAAGEGVLGLRRAFQVAGARTVIMSLWSVDDRAARHWMDALYRARLVQGLDSANAMREASINFIRDRRARGQSTHPFYWASFVAAGDWR